MDGEVMNAAPAASTSTPVQSTPAPAPQASASQQQQTAPAQVVSTNVDTKDMTTASNAILTTEHPQSFNNSDIESKGKWALEVDPKTGLKDIRFVTEKPQKPAETTEKKEYVIPDATQQVPNATNITSIVSPQPPAQTVKPYTDNEFLVAMQMDSVDESRVPAQYKTQFETAKQQRAAAMNTQKQQTANGQQATQAAKPEVDAKAYTDFYNRINTMAQDNAMKEIGITKEELDAADYSDDPELLAKYQAYKTAVNYHRNSIEYAIRSKDEAVKRETAEKQQAVERMRNDIASKVRELQGSEPNFAKIDAYMSNRYRSLPFEQAKPIAEIYDTFMQGGAPTPEQAQLLLKYYEDSRKDFYARNNNLATAPTPVAKPAVVEQPGTGANSPKKAPDFKSLGKMDLDGKDAFIAKLFGR